MARKKNTLKRKEVATVAYRLFIEQGYEETNLSQIAKGCDISKSLLQRYYVKKEDILLDVMDRIINACYCFILEIISQTLDETEFFSVAERLIMLAYSSKLLPIAMAICKDMNLVFMIMKMLIKQLFFPDELAEMEWQIHRKVPLYSFMGNISMLIVASRSGELDITIESGLEISLKHYYYDIGIREPKVTELIDLSRSLVTEQTCKNFIDYYEQYFFNQDDESALD